MVQRYYHRFGMQGDFVEALRECYNRKSSAEQISSIKTVLAKQREKIRLLNRSGASGTETVRFISEMADTLIRVMWDQIEMSVPNEDDLVSIVAVGGYGRMELCPQSDIDILILTSSSPTTEELRQAEIIVRNLWDYGFVVGSSVRSLSQCEEASKKDAETWTSFLNERFLSGNHGLYRKFVKLMKKPLFSWRSSALIEAKIKEREHRKSQTGLLVQLLEPNLKEGNGCLRDVHSMMWIAQVKYSCQDFEDLVREGFITPQELEDIRVAYDFLLQVRCCLHFITQKKDDYLSFEIQPEIALELDFKEEANQKPVEVFLKVFYHHTKTINRITEAVISRWVKPEGAKGSRENLKNHAHFKVEDDALDIKARVGNPFIDQVNLIMEYFELANEKNFGYAHHAVMRIKQAVSVLSASQFEPKEYLPEFLRLCKSPLRVGRMLRAMNDVGLIGLIIPDFNYIYCHSQHDIYHIYTTDEHTITVVRQLAYLGQRPEKELSSLRKAVSLVNDMDTLVLVSFFHDIGKGVGPKHSITGAKMVFDYMDAMGFSASRCKEASNLVLHHLLMNEIIQRRDLGDPKTIRDFIAKVETPATLHKLYVLTYCDVSSVHPDAWSNWKASLLQKLYNLALEAMQTPMEAAISKRDLQEMLIENISKRFSEQEVRTHLELLPGHYANSTSPEEIIQHIQLISTLGKQKFNAQVFATNTHWEVTIVAADDVALLCGIAGTMAHLELSILSSHIYTRIDGVAIDKFQVSVSARNKFTPESLKKKLCEELEKNFRLSREELFTLQKKFKTGFQFGKRKELPVAAEIFFSNTISDSFSTVDFTCKDRLGLLYQVTKVFSELRLNVHGAVLTTEADKAMDSFYITDMHEEKIVGQEMIDKIITTLKIELSSI